MRAFTDTIENKEQALIRAAEHRAADMYKQGAYWDEEDQKGCSVGCMMKPFMEEGKTNWHETAERVHGIPREIAYLQDRMFERMDVEKANAWTERFYHAIPVGADLSLVTSRFLYWLLTDPDMVRKHATGDGLVAIERVAKLYERRLQGDTVSEAEWKDAARAAYAADAAADAAYAAADAAYAAARAAYAADAAADAAYAAARAAYAADAAADAADAAARAAFDRMADKLIELLADAPVTPEETRMAV